jgi:hypothetical protein
MQLVNWKLFEMRPRYQCRVFDRWKLSDPNGHTHRISALVKLNRFLEWIRLMIFALIDEGKMDMDEIRITFSWYIDSLAEFQIVLVHYSELRLANQEQALYSLAKVAELIKARVDSIMNCRGFFNISSVDVYAHWCDGGDDWTWCTRARSVRHTEYPLPLRQCGTCGMLADIMGNLVVDLKELLTLFCRTMSMAGWVRHLNERHGEWRKFWSRTERNRYIWKVRRAQSRLSFPINLLEPDAMIRPFINWMPWPVRMYWHRMSKPILKSMKAALTMHITEVPVTKLMAPAYKHFTPAQMHGLFNLAISLA